MVPLPFSRLTLKTMKFPGFDTLTRRLEYWYGRYHVRVIDRLARYWTCGLATVLLLAGVAVPFVHRWGPSAAMAVVVLLSGFVSLYRHASRSSRLDAGQGITVTMRWLLLGAAAWWLLALGDPILALILAHPTYPVAVTIASLTAWLILRDGSTDAAPADVPLAINRRSRPLFPMGARNVELSEHDLAVNASHETGHVLLYAAWPTVRLRFTVELRTDATREWLGVVQGQVPDLHVITEEHARWSMLLHLAGQAAERYIHGQGSLGAGDDYDKWQHAARRYLRAGLGQARLIEDPVNAAEVAWNERVLDELHRTHMDTLQAFLALNDAVLRKLRDALLRNGYMNDHDATDHFARVCFPDDFPRPVPDPRYHAVKALNIT
ncbi:hypothetical protein KEX41_28225 (plasmid) [Burkholderia thailandensis]|uniref:hypothetical protein n=1 Tax=Burkholderia thailandensis TaxID=57975 RepID=UPI00192E0C18|nr:hypothetical protein [Burkholderia thailandensis]MBS2132077.1 hypothetical protein [Burkholderia thailandensis]QRA15190.1 hypothetical protein JMY07_30260 [Burkholderia thailandensis]